jgi:peptidyl-Asp metalloendopeptidase
MLIGILVIQGCGVWGVDSRLNKNESSRVCKPKQVQEPEDLFIELEAESHGEVSEQAVGGSTVRRRKVAVNFERFHVSIGEGRSLRMTLFQDRDLEVRIEKIEPLAEGEVVLLGRVLGHELSSVTVVVKDDVMVANLNLEGMGEHFQIRYEGGGIHVIRELTGVHKGECHAHEPPGYSVLGEGLETESQTSLSPLSTPVADLLVVYTPAARIKQGGTSGIKALIQLGIADTNRAFAESGVGLSVRLVGTMETRQNETEDFSADLASLRGTTDGLWDEVHAERRRLGADQVSLVGAYNGNTTVAGLAYVGASASSAFSITRTSAFGQYTFSHELGHNIGLRHGDGYENMAGRFRTVMAYGTQPRVRRFSSPVYPYNGYITGTSTQDSAKIINANAARFAGLVAAVSSSTPTPTPTPTPTFASPTPTPASTPAPTPAPTALPSDECL